TSRRRQAARNPRRTDEASHDHRAPPARARDAGRRAAVGRSTVAAAEPRGAAAGLGELPAVPAAAPAAAAHDRASLPAVPGHAAAGAAAAPAELRGVSRLQSRAATGVHGEVSPLEIGAVAGLSLAIAARPDGGLRSSRGPLAPPAARAATPCIGGPGARDPVRRCDPRPAARARVENRSAGWAGAPALTSGYSSTTSWPPTWAGWRWHVIGKMPALSAVNSTVLGSPRTTVSAML